MQLKHFTLSEFDSPDAPGSGAKMKPEFLQRLDNARSIAKIPFGINSGFRQLLIMLRLVVLIQAVTLKVGQQTLLVRMGLRDG